MGLRQIGDQNRQNAMTGYQGLSQLESNRDNYNKQGKAQHKAKQGSAIGSGISVAMMTGNPMLGAGVAVMGLLF